MAPAGSTAAKAILIVLDGLGDRQCKKFGWKTPLQAAKKPALDEMSKLGSNGMLYSISPGVTPGSDTAHLEILGYDTAKYYPKRGPLEALGAGLKLREGDVAFRCNFATVDANLNVLDRRAGRIDTKTGRELAKALQGLAVDGARVSVRHTAEHRCAVVIHGAKGCNVTETDPHGKGRLPKCRALDSQSERTAGIVNALAGEIHSRLAGHEINKRLKSQGRPQANMLLFRGAGQYFKVPAFAERFGMSAACVAGGALYKGVARFVGMQAPDVAGATGDADTSLKSKLAAAEKALRSHDFVFLHIKATDTFGHDGDFTRKKAMIEKIDREVLAPLLKLINKSEGHIVLGLTGDHSTPACNGEHSGDAVPIVFYSRDNKRVDSVRKFDEISCASGNLGCIEGRHVIPLFLNFTGRGKKYGA